MKSVFTFIFLFSLQGLSQVVDMKKYLNPELSEGQCHSMADTKVYLKNLKDGSIAVQTAAEIGAQRIKNLENTDQESFYFCKVKCRLNNTLHTLWNTQKDKNENFKNLQGFVCQGLEITDVDLSSTLSIKTTIARTFEAANSLSPDIRNYLKSISYKLPAEVLSSYLFKFKSNVNLVANAYIASQNADLINAGQYLQTLNFSNEQESKKIIHEKVIELSKLQWSKPTDYSQFFKKENVMDRFLIEYGKFFEFVEF